MQPYLAHTQLALRLLSRDRTALFFNYIFPLLFLGLFGALFGGAKNPGAMLQVISIVLTLGVINNGLFGAGLRVVQDREQNILRRFKVTPAGARPILFAAVASGIIAYVPLLFLVFSIGYFWMHVPVPVRVVELVLFSFVGLIAFRGLGLLISSVVASTGEAQGLIQLFFMPMFMLSGAMLPLEMLPPWLRATAGFLPSAYLFSGLQAMLLNHAGFAHVAWAAVALLLMGGGTIFLALKLFRWDMDEPAPRRAKWWLAVGLAPFVFLGLVQLKSGQRLNEARMQARAMRRNSTFVVENVRIFVGNGPVIEHGRVLVRGGLIKEVGEQTSAREPADAEVVNGAGKTLLPGLIDLHVHLGAAGTTSFDSSDTHAEAHRLAAYLYCGVTAVRSVGDFLDKSLELKRQVANGELLGAELFVYGPLFTAEGGHGTEFLNQMAASIRAVARDQFLRIPKNPEDARKQVGELQAAGVDGIKAILQGDFGRMHFVRLDHPIYEAVAAAAHAAGLPLATHTNTARDVEEAIAAHSETIEHGSLTDRLPAADFAAMREAHLAYDPTLSVVSVFRDLAGNAMPALDSSLLQQVFPADKLAELRRSVIQHQGAIAALGLSGADLYANASANLLTARQAGVTLIAGSDAGNPYILHGPTVQRELALWVEAGIPPKVALQAATGDAARYLRADARIGLIAPGHQATFITVEGDPTTDIRALEHVTGVYFRGEHVDRRDLLEDSK